MTRKLKTMDGNMAAAYVSYAFTETAAIYPITPSSPMADYTGIWALNNKKNIFGHPVRLVQMQSEAGAAGAFHGMLNAGTLAVTYTSSQGLLLMIPNMYKVAGELLPGVINVAARTVATHALSIFGDHQDVYACRQTGFAMLSSGNVQEVMDLGAVAHLSAIEGRVPFIHFFDGFRTSHEIQKIEIWDYDILKRLCNMEAVKAFKKRALNPERPVLRGSAQNPDVFFQIRESSNMYYNMLPEIVEKYMNLVNDECNTDYKLFNYYGDKDAESVIIAMGSVCDTIEETIDIIKKFENKSVNELNRNDDYTDELNRSGNVNKNELKNIRLNESDIVKSKGCKDTIDTLKLKNKKNAKIGLIRVHLYRPFSKEHLIKAIPPTVKVINVLDRTKEPGAAAEPLYEDVVTALKGSEYENTKVLGGRYGLSSKNTTPKDIAAVFNNDNKNNYTVGIKDDVTHTSLDSDMYSEYISRAAECKKDSQDIKSKNKVKNSNMQECIKKINGNYSCKFWGIGADGTVGANKNIIKIIGDNTDMHVQAYFEYDSKKSGGLTISHIRFGNERIKAAYLIENADFVSCSTYKFLNKYALIRQINKNGILLVNCDKDDKTFLAELSSQDRDYICQNNISVYVIDAAEIAKKTGLGLRIGTIMQAAFFKIVNVMDIEKAVEYMKQSVNKTYASKGDDVVNMNYDAIDMAVFNLRRVDINNEDVKKSGTSNAIGEDMASKFLIMDSGINSNNTLEDSTKGDVTKEKITEQNNMIVNKKTNSLTEDFVKNIQTPVNHCKGDDLPVSTFINMADGTLPPGTSAYEKRGVSGSVPLWNPHGCIQCNRCSFVCPHSVIRPVTLTAEQAAHAPSDMRMAPMAGEEGKYFSITISTYDCTGCTLCTDICPGNIKNNVLKMNDFDKAKQQQEYYEYGLGNNDNGEVHEHFPRTTVKGSQFFTPLLEFSGACAGCGETAYAKLVTQLFGERMIIANATGCSSIWAGSMPSAAYTVNDSGKGPAWSNSLFEDAAEYGYGMQLATEYNRHLIWDKLKSLKNIICKKQDKNNILSELSELIDSYEKNYDDGRINSIIADKIVARLNEYKDINNSGNVFDISIKNENEKDNIIDYILTNKEFLSKKSCWVFGGDGWAYDIGYGGLDHVVSTGVDINILVFDTEVYSNTGGQVSKATNMGAVAQFAADGKCTEKKRLADMLMSYKNVYVAQVSLGADMNQCIKAINEAEKYNGPSVIIAYAPCINHGIYGGMAMCTKEQKNAVLAGYWNLFRYNPEKMLSGKNAFILDSNAPKIEFTEFLMSENRFASLKRKDKDRADILFAGAQKTAQERYEYYKRLSEGL